MIFYYVMSQKMMDFCMCVFVPRPGILMRQLKFQNEKISIQESIGIGKRRIKNGVIIGIYEKKSKLSISLKLFHHTSKRRQERLETRE